MSTSSTGFLDAHAARGTRSVLKLGLGLTLAGAALSAPLGNVYGFAFV